jgi:hypothetical protein
MKPLLPRFLEYLPGPGIGFNLKILSSEMDQAKSGLPFDISLLNGEARRFSARWSCNFKGLSQDGGRIDFSKKLCTSLFNKYLPIE